MCMWRRTLRRSSTAREWRAGSDWRMPSPDIGRFLQAWWWCLAMNVLVVALDNFGDVHRAIAAAGLGAYARSSRSHDTMGDMTSDSARRMSRSFSTPDWDYGARQAWCTSFDLRDRDVISRVLTQRGEARIRRPTIGAAPLYFLHHKASSCFRCDFFVLRELQQNAILYSELH